MQTATSRSWLGRTFLGYLPTASPGPDPDGSDPHHYERQDLSNGQKAPSHLKGDRDWRDLRGDGSRGWRDSSTGKGNQPEEAAHEESNDSKAKEHQRQPEGPCPTPERANYDQNNKAEYDQSLHSEAHDREDTKAPRHLFGLTWRDAFRCEHCGLGHCRDQRQHRWSCRNKQPETEHGDGDHEPLQGERPLGCDSLARGGTKRIRNPLAAVKPEAAVGRESQLPAGAIPPVAAIRRVHLSVRIDPTVARCGATNGAAHQRPSGTWDASEENGSAAGPAAWLDASGHQAASGFPWWLSQVRNDGLLRVLVDHQIRTDSGTAGRTQLPRPCGALAS